jgi:hypothetical protein
LIENYSIPEAELWAILHFLACGGRESDSWLSSLEVLEGAEDSVTHFCNSVMIIDFITYECEKRKLFPFPYECEKRKWFPFSY